MKTFIERKIHTEHLGKQIEEKAFELGFRWSDNTDDTDDANLDYCYFSFHSDGTMTRSENPLVYFDYVEIASPETFLTATVTKVKTNIRTLRETKVYVGKHSKKIQRKAFKLGCEWMSGGQEVIDLKHPFLYITQDFKITNEGNISDFNDHHFIEITPDEIFSIQHEFNSFDKVLVRDKEEEIWTCDFFSHYKHEGNHNFVTIKGRFKMCIPYEGNEHLVSTTYNISKW